MLLSPHSNPFRERWRSLKLATLSVMSASLGAGLSLVIVGDRSIAQITPDNTLGNERSRVTADVIVEGAVGDRINGGATRASYLFHSFEAFNVGEMERVYFATPAGIETILSRVTGNDVSDILGTLGVEGQANLFFLNPNGIVFGDNAVLDIRGSFVATTANRFTFPDGSRYSAVNPEAPPLLTVNVTPGLQYGANPGAIANRGNLSVGRDMTLAAGRLTHTGELTAEFGQLTLEAHDGSLEVMGGTLTALGDMTLEATETVNLEDGAIATDGRLLVTSDAAIDISGSTILSEADMVFRAPVRQFGGATSIYTTGGYFITEATDGSVVDFLIPHPEVILADGDVQLDANYAGDSLYVLAGGSFTTAADVDEITVVDGVNGTITQVILDGNNNPQTVTVAASLQSTLDIRTGIDWASLPGGPPGNINNSEAIASFGAPADPAAATSADIDLGNTDVRLIGRSAELAGRLALSNQFRPNAAFDGDLLISAVDTTPFFFDGFAPGSVTLQSRGRAVVDGSINVTHPLFFFNGVNSGNVTIIADDDIQFLPGSTIEAIGALGGEIELVSCQGDIFIEDTFIGSASLDTGIRGDRVPGRISLDAESIFVNNFGSIGIAVVSGEQVGGQLNIRASDSIEIVSNDEPGTVNAVNPIIDFIIDTFNGTGFASATLGEASAGAIVIETGDLLIRNAGEISDPNDVPPVSEDEFLPNLTGISSATVPFQGVNGDAGSIRIVADAITLAGNQPGEFIPPSQADRANLVRAVNTGITATSQGQGLTGDIIIDVARLDIRDGAAITGGNVAAPGLDAPEDSISAGTIAIDADDVIRLRGKAVIATGTLSQSDAGSLVLTIAESGEGLFLENGGLISADTIILDDNPDGVTAGAAGDIAITAPAIQLSNNSRISSASGVNGGEAGTIEIGVGALDISNSLISTSSENDIQTAGNIILAAADRIVIGGSIEDELQDDRPGGILAEATLGGDAGFVAVSTPQLQIDANGAILTSTTSGLGGSIQISDLERATFTNGEISASTQTGTAGSVSIEGSRSGGDAGSDRLILQGSNSSIAAQATTAGGSAGDVRLTLNHIQVLDGATISVSNQTTDEGGNVQLGGVNTLTLRNGQITASTQTGAAGGVTVNSGEAAAASIRLEGVGSAIAARAEVAMGDAGGVRLNTQRLDVLDGARIEVSTQTGTAGSIRVSADDGAADSIVLRGVGSAIAAQANEAEGTAGNLSLASRSLQIANGARFSASNVSSAVGGNIQFQDVERLQLNQGQITAATADGVAGDIILNPTGSAVDRVVLRDSAIQIEATGTGEAGSIRFRTEALEMTDNAELRATSLSGEGGDIMLSELTAAQLADSSILASSESGPGGDIRLEGAFTAQLTDGSTIEATSITGRGGDIELNGLTTLDLDASRLVTSSRTHRGGDIRLSGQFDAQLNRSAIRTSSQSGEGGNIGLSGLTSLQLDRSRVQASSQSGEGGSIALRGDFSAQVNNSIVEASSLSGQGGDIVLRGLETLEVDNSRISAATTTGRAGSLSIAASDQIRLTNRAVLSVEASETSPSSQTSRSRLRSRPSGATIPVAGNLTLQTDQLLAEDQSTITVSSPEGIAGNLTIRAREVRLLNQSSITAETGVSRGNSSANIDLTASDLLLLRTNSLISAEARDDANGGNITIANENGFIVAVNTENSDIVANAVRGQGGNIDITTQGLFGITVRDRLTPFSDITASSEAGIDGTIIVRQPDVDPSRGLIELPGTLIGADDRLEQNVCRATRDSSFIVVGRGGLPPTPDELFGSHDIWQDQRLMFVEEEMHGGEHERGDRPVGVNANATTEDPAVIVEAQDWQRDASGRVVLVAAASAGAAQPPQATFPNCQTPIPLPFSSDGD